MWLNLLQKVPTWDYLQEKQKYHASLYYLCKMESKDVTHLFTSCFYYVQCYKDVCNWIDTIMPQSKGKTCVRESAFIISSSKVIDSTSTELNST